ncbi:MAG: ornithine cyclodeaminase family protein [Chloroflexota bacterium]
MSNNTLRYLSGADVVQALPMAEAVEGMKQAYAQLSTGKAQVPLRARVQTDGTTLVMPAAVPETGGLAVKIVSVFPSNAQRGIPTIHALVMALDAETGIPTAIMEGGTLTAIRTGAGSGAATDILARPDSRTVAIIGSGVQARTQLEAVCAVRDVAHVFVYSRTSASAEAFAAEMAGKAGVPDNITVAATADDAVREADIVCAATTSTTPVFSGDALKPGTHISGVGSFRPEMQELDLTTIKKSLVVVDSREAVLEEAGELIIPLNNGDIEMSHIHTELGEIVAGSATGRTDNDQITFFKSVGVAVQDVVAATIVVKNASTNDLGTLLPL